jgi:hypothetical protein
MGAARAKKQEKEDKIHGDPLEASVTPERSHETAEQNSAIPPAEEGGHARSQAAHLGGNVHDHTKPVGDLRRYEFEREPPQEVSRAGKDYRRQ